MQNNVTELTQKLLRSLDSNYNVIDMPAVIEIISQLEKISITKELLETTRLGKYVNQLRRNTTNKLLAKRAKDLVKKWRDSVLLVDANGQLKHASDEPAQNKKRPKDASDGAVPQPNVKRPRVNGQMSELDFSDNSNSSFKDVVAATKSVIIINSDSNSSVPDHRHEPPLEQQQPKKRGRKKGSKNHKNLIEEAETSFSNKLNVSRGNAKVKTTQELLADLQIKSNSATNVVGGKPVEDLNEKAAKLSERVSIIDQKLNATSNRYNRNFQRKSSVKTEVVESGIVSNVKSSDDDEIIIVDDVEEEKKPPAAAVAPPIEPEEVSDVPKSLTVEEALALLPPIDRGVLDETDPEPTCTCQLIENKTNFSVADDDDEVNLQHTFEFVEDDSCVARNHLVKKYNLSLNGELLSRQVNRLHAECIPSVNGSCGVGSCKPEPRQTDDGLYVNVVPNVNTENLLKFSSMDYSQPASENFKKYSISEGKRDGDEDDDEPQVSLEGVAKNESVSEANSDSDTRTFREWHEVLDTPSYNGEIFKILPYVIID